ncbi:hypothetical protein METHB2_300039 [Candidatus Methylobacter favarea]|uniref:Uncharacterized protein n=1 Tax=Candidatus Methylobacter favarea TaxID=2707345 RepID=A0A8S0YA16_9GAMM|nr:hypothetical protein METHB2_300039 [Candidatus Methylobacter favarea]
MPELLSVRLWLCGEIRGAIFGSVLNHTNPGGKSHKIIYKNPDSIPSATNVTLTLRKHNSRFCRVETILNLLNCFITE